MYQKGRQRGGAHAPPDLGRSEGAAGSGGAPHYYVPPQIFRLWTMPDYMIDNSKNRKKKIQKTLGQTFLI